MTGRAIDGNPYSGAAPARSAARAAWKALCSGLSAFMSTIQTVRMASVLGQMSDAQLAQMGIERHEIFTHAEKLISGGKK